MTHFLDHQAPEAMTNEDNGTVTLQIQTQYRFSVKWTPPAFEYCQDRSFTMLRRRLPPRARRSTKSGSSKASDGYTNAKSLARGKSSGRKSFNHIVSFFIQVLGYSEPRPWTAITLRMMRSQAIIEAEHTYSTIGSSGFLGSPSANSSFKPPSTGTFSARRLFWASA
jgi:hypothetical protein